MVQGRVSDGVKWEEQEGDRREALHLVLSKLQLCCAYCSLPRQMRVFISEEGKFCQMCGFVFLLACLFLIFVFLVCFLPLAWGEMVLSCPSCF